jgi:hypothetical protein
MKMEIPFLENINQKEIIMYHGSHEILKVIESKNGVSLRSDSSIVCRLPIDTSSDDNLITITDALGAKGIANHIMRNHLNKVRKRKLLAKVLLALKLLKKDYQGKLVILDHTKVCFDSKKLVGKRVQLLGKGSFKIHGFRHRNGRSMPITFDWLEAEWKKEKNQENLKIIEDNCELVVMNPVASLNQKDLDSVRDNYYTELSELCKSFTGEGKRNSSLFNKFDESIRENEYYYVTEKDCKIKTKSGKPILKRKYQNFFNKMHDVSNALIIPIVTDLKKTIVELNNRVENLECKNEKLSQDNEKLSQDNEKLTSRVENLEYENEKLTIKICKLKKMVMRRDARIAELEKRMDEMEMMMNK